MPKNLVWLRIAAALFSLGFSAAAGAQTEILLHSFAGGPSGLQPEGSLLFDPQGNLYGVTFGGGDLRSRDCD